MYTLPWNQWRQREFKVGARSAEEGGYGEGVPLPSGEGSVEEEVPPPQKFLFRDLEMAYFGEFWGAKFKVCNNIGGYSH